MGTVAVCPICRGVGKRGAGVTATCRDWVANAACRNHPALFQATFDEPDPSDAHPLRTARARLRRAKKICSTCDVTEECLMFLASLPRSQQHYGVWGGLSPLEREAPHVAAS